MNGRMTNKEWLDYLAQNAPDELAAWFDAERTESPKSDETRRIEQVIENTVKRGVQGDVEPENKDSRELLEAEIRYEYNGAISTEADEIIAWLDRQAAITERETTKSHELFCETCEAESDKQIAELTADNDRLAKLLSKSLEEYSKLEAERDKLQRHCENQRRELAELNNVVNVHRIVHEDGQVDVFSVRELCRRNDELTAEREHYRSKFGKCLDYADAIHALMDDEGMA